MTDFINGWFAALVAQHVYQDGVPLPQRRAWNFIGPQWSFTDDPINDKIDFTYTGNEAFPAFSLENSAEPPGQADANYILGAASGDKLYIKDDATGAVVLQPAGGTFAGVGDAQLLSDVDDVNSARVVLDASAGSAGVVADDIVLNAAGTVTVLSPAVEITSAAFTVNGSPLPTTYIHAETGFLRIENPGAPANDAIRVTPDGGGPLYLDTATIYLNAIGSYSQFISPRFTIATPDGICFDFNHTSTEGRIGYSAQLRFGGDVSEHYLGLWAALPSEQQAVTNYSDTLQALARVGAVYDTSKGYTVDLYGDSLWSIGATVPQNRASRKLEGKLSTAAAVHARTIPGEAGTNPAHTYQPVPTSAGKAIAVLTYGANNFIGGQSDATMRAITTAEVAALTAAGYDAIVVSTVTPYGNLSVPQEAERASYNTWLKANFGSIGADACADPDSDPNLSDPTDLTYYQADELHFTDAGLDSYADVFAAAVNPLLTGATRAGLDLHGHDVALTADGDMAIACDGALDIDAVGAVNVDCTAGFDIDCTVLDVTGSTSVTCTSGSQTFTLSGGGFFSQLITHIFIEATNYRVERNAGSITFAHRLTVQATTTNNTTANATFDHGGANFTTVSNRVYRVKADIVVSNDTDNEAGEFETRRALFRNVAGTLTKVSTTKPTAPEDTLEGALSAATLDFDANGTDIRLRVTGVTGKTIQWRGHVTIQEVTLT